MSLLYYLENANERFTNARAKLMNVVLASLRELQGSTLILHQGRTSLFWVPATINHISNGHVLVVELELGNAIKRRMESQEKIELAEGLINVIENAGDCIEFYHTRDNKKFLYLLHHVRIENNILTFIVDGDDWDVT